jgi:general secretion pathway protein J
MTNSLVTLPARSGLTAGSALRRRGMTMIEIMVAMAILSIIATLLYSGFIQTSHNKQRIEDQLERSHEITSGIERMAEELSMAYVSWQTNKPNPLSANHPVMTAFIAKEQGSGSRIDFSAFSHRRLYRNAHESDQNEVSYFLTHEKKSGQQVLARREQRRIDDDPEKGGQSQILIQNVRTFKLSFLDPLTTMWVQTWDTVQSSGQPNRLPSQAKILVTVPNLSGHGADQVFGTRTWFPMAYGLNFAIYK